MSKNKTLTLGQKIFKTVKFVGNVSIGLFFLGYVWVEGGTLYNNLSYSKSYCADIDYGYMPSSARLIEPSNDGFVPDKPTPGFIPDTYQPKEDCISTIKRADIRSSLKNFVYAGAIFLFFTFLWNFLVTRIYKIWI